MKLVDTNVLLHAVNPATPEHRVARTWLDHGLSGSAPLGFAWLALIGFVRLTTHPAIFDHPITPDQAIGQVASWLDSRSAHVLHPGPGHAARLLEMLEATNGAGELTNDAHLAALAAEHRASIVSFDSDFSRFPGVRWERPT